MTDIENVFYTLYKTVDSICRDMFSGEGLYNEKGEEVFGVSAYIREMEKTDYSVRARFPEWNDEYKKLKRLRWIRTEIAHSTEISECCEDDLDDLDNFYEQILSQNDILARAGRSVKKQTPSKKPAIRYRQTDTRYSSPANYTYQPQSEQRGSNAWLWVLGVIAALLIAFFMLNR